MNERSLRIVLASLVLAPTLGMPGPVFAAEAITMPYSCAMKDGKATISSAAQTRHDILGERQQREYRACKDRAGQDCLTMTVYKFKISCQGQAADWAEIAAQIRSNDVGSSWIEKGQLNLVLKNGLAASGSRRKARLVMPVGHAPLVELGAHLTEVGAADEVAGSDVPAANGEIIEVGLSHANGGKPIIPTIDNAVVVIGSDGQSQGEFELTAVEEGERSSSQGWKAVVSHGDDPVMGSIDGGATALSLGAGQLSNFAMFAFVLAGSSLVVALGWYGRRFASMLLGGGIADTRVATAQSIQPVPQGMAARFSGAAGGIGAKLHSRWLSFKWRRLKSGKPWKLNNASIANGAQAAEALYGKADTAVKRLGQASALRDILSAELRSVRQRLDGLRGGHGDQPKTARAAASLRAAVRDLERIGRIAESAAASVKGSVDDIVIPKTRAEAFEVLGLNANATEGTLKRIVDALRMGWHPDHAQDEIDKRQREERTKQINIAWDLIVGKRAV